METVEPEEGVRVWSAVHIRAARPRAVAAALLPWKSGGRAGGRAGGGGGTKGTRCCQHDNQLTSISVSWEDRTLTTRSDRLLFVRLPTQYDASFHQGRPKLLSQSVRGTVGGMWRKRPNGVNGTRHPVTGSTCCRTSLVLASNQCEMSVPAAATIGSSSSESGREVGVEEEGG